MTKTIVLCADDFGQAPHISEAILTLAKQNRLSAISCMTTAEDWEHQGKKLRAFQGRLDLGLHFNLTWGATYPPSPTSWLLRAFTGRIDPNFIEAQLTTQLTRFEAITGFLPDFIDGHQHVHSFPFIRQSLVKVLQKRFGSTPPYVRTLSPLLSGHDAGIKAYVIRCASFGFSRTLDRHKIYHNSSFGGLYSLKEQAPYRKYMQHWLEKACQGTLLMCHPGLLLLEGTVDPIQHARFQEYQYFLSPAFQEDCARADVSLGRLKRAQGFDFSSL